MADALLETGLASGAVQLEAALWDVDIRILQQVMHARGARTGAKLAWRGTGPADESLAERMKQLNEREFSWQSEPR